MAVQSYQGDLDGRTRPLFEEVAPLRERMLDEIGHGFLEAIAHQQRNLLTCKARHLPGGRNDDDTRQRVNSLAMLGLVNVNVALRKTGANESYILTQEGWEIVGGKPIWM